MEITSSNELKAIEAWTSIEKEYKYIKAVLKGEKIGKEQKKYEEMAYSLLGMFSNHKDNTNGKDLYRGDVIESEEEYDEISSKKEGDTFYLEKSILSFSLDKDIAMDAFSVSCGKYVKGITPSILITIKKRSSVFLDISEYSNCPEEKEVLCDKELKFIIKSINVSKDKHIDLVLNEVTK